MRRNWHVSVINSSHCDPGWHDLPERILALQARQLDQVVALCEQTQSAPADQRFRFTVEHAYVLDYYERHRSAEQFELLLACVQRGQIEIGAIYAGVHTDLCGHEELARLTSYATGLRRRWAVPVNAALLNDVSEGYTMGLPQVLAKSGIHSIAFGPGVKAIVYGIAPQVPRIFRWRTPDGSSVLVGWTPGYWTYNSWSEAGFKGEETLRVFDELGEAYPYDLFFRHGGAGDNASPSLEILETLQGWREAALPDLAQIEIGSVATFFTELESRFGEQIPTVQGDAPASWADGTISLARETAMHRQSQRDALSAEFLASLATDPSFIKATTPALDRIQVQEQLREVYRNLHFYSDHTWGLDLETGLTPGSRLGRATSNGTATESETALTADIDVTDPIFDEWRASWDAKRVYAQEARRLVSELTTSALNNLTTALASSSETPGLVLWNTLSWSRVELVRLPWSSLPEGTPSSFALVDPRDNREIPWQRERRADGNFELVFVAPSLPAAGYLMLRIESRAPTQSPEPDKAIQLFGEAEASNREAPLENERYRLVVDPARGTLTSLFDKALGRELLDIAAEHHFGQYIHADVTECYVGTGTAEKAGSAHGPGTRFSPEQVESVTLQRGPVTAVLRIQSRLSSGPAPAMVTTTLTLPNASECDWLDLDVQIDKRESLRKEQVYLAFPFAIGAVEDAQASPAVQAHIELPYAVLNWNRDILPGAWHGYSSVQTWLDVSDEQGGVTLAPIDAPVVCLGGITSNEWDPAWHQHYRPENGHVYSYLMSNIWNCNYALWQGGPMQFRYRLTSHAGSCQQEIATRFGWEAGAPIQVTSLNGKHDAPVNGVLASSTALDGLHIAESNVIAPVLKRAEDGRGWIVRLYETGEQAYTLAHLRATFLSSAPQAAYVTSLAEDDIEPLLLDGDIISVPLKAHELATIRLLA